MVDGVNANSHAILLKCSAFSFCLPAFCIISENEHEPPSNHDCYTEFTAFPNNIILHSMYKTEYSRINELNCIWLQTNKRMNERMKWNCILCYFLFGCNFFCCSLWFGLNALILGIWR